MAYAQMSNIKKLIFTKPINICFMALLFCFCIVYSMNKLPMNWNSYCGYKHFHCANGHGSREELFHHKRNGGSSEENKLNSTIAEGNGRPNSSKEVIQWIFKSDNVLDLTPFITLFTTFKESKERFVIYNHTVKNWASLKPEVYPVLFTYEKHSELMDTALERGWDVIPMTAVNQHGTPYIKEMYRVAYEKYQSTFYAFANGDILFSHNLIATLKRVFTFYNNHNKGKLLPPFITGRRTNFVLDDKTLRITDIWRPEFVKEKSSHLPKDNIHCLDYFFTLRNGFPWDKIPNLVIGRPLYDKFLHLVAIYFNMTTVDITKTISNLHLKGKGHKLTYLDGNEDNNFNFQTVMQYGYVSHRLGDVDKGRYYSLLKEGSIEIMENPKWNWMHEYVTVEDNLRNYSQFVQ